METTNLNGKTGSGRDDEISLKELILKIREWARYLLSQWKIILVSGFIGGLLGLTYAWFKKPVYTATCTFVLEDSKSVGGLGQYAGLAAMAGINLGGGGDGLFQGDNILELYKSRAMLEKTLLSYGRFNGKKDLLINRYIEINKLRDAWSEKPKLRNLSFNIQKSEFTRQHDSVMTEVIGDINKSCLTVTKPDKKTSIIEVDVKSKDEQFAKNFADQVMATVNDFYLQTKTKKSSDNIRILQRQADSVRRVLNASIGSTATAMDANPNANPALLILRVPSQRKQIDVQASSAIYSEIVKNLELAKMSARQDAPLIQIVDEPVLPLKYNKLGRIKSAIIGGILFCVLSIACLMAKYIVRNTKWD